MSTEGTNNTPDYNASTLSPEGLLIEVEKAWGEPIIIGAILGVPVYLNRQRRTLSTAGMVMPIDHPYLDGTRLQRVARRLADGEEFSTADL